METLAFLYNCALYEDSDNDFSVRSPAAPTPFTAAQTLWKLCGGVMAVSLLAAVPAVQAAAQRGDISSTVQTVQQLLARKGHHPGSTDGIFGGKTEHAVRLFQQHQGLAPSGIVDAATAAVLGLDAYSSAQAPQPVQATHLVLKRGERKVYVHQGPEVIASYPVGVGKPGWETPLGTFQVRTMLKDPGWTNPFTGEVMSPDSNNPLGERWIEFWTDGEGSLGFHGTPQRESVGQAVSHGCVRMYDEDIQELYEWVSAGVPVIVVP